GKYNRSQRDISSIRFIVRFLDLHTPPRVKKDSANQSLCRLKVNPTLLYRALTGDVKELRSRRMATKAGTSRVIGRQFPTQIKTM
ncbi:MAG TPA: hypothetical protein VI750_07825, partial [Pyrinomonadaceae bacterium]|nr:hypothetical protein [Pyrinomonadaceae bacterium]